ncbi:MAG: hypothetical protein C4519_03195 [Desulfobacteraceae bacterium]|nr:MAG: hypothetical protein C4519_03195 [Desulfobacteraceae bacterium]
MFIRLLILIIIAVVAYRAVKSWLGGPSRQQVRKDGRVPLKADDVMIQDPQCGVYFARRDAVEFNENGKTLYFCSQACKDAYLAKGKG